MPNRILREGIIESESVNSLTPTAELFYRRLMSKVDDYGRFHGHPALVLAACYPLQLDRVSMQNVVDWMSECEEFNLIKVYEVSGKKYVLINNFGQRERTDSKFPAPCAQNVREMLASGQHVACSRARASESESESESESGGECGRVARNGADNLPDVVSRMIEAHPKPATRTLVEHAIIAAAARGDPVADIEACHAAWSRTENWTEKDAKYCPKLERWIDDRGYKKWPKGKPVDAEKRASFKDLFGNTPSASGG